MKLRIRCGEQRSLLEVLPREPTSQDVTLGDVREKIRTVLGLGTTTFDVSLNGKDPLHGEETVMNEFGVVAGDLLYVLLAAAEDVVSPSGGQSIEQTSAESSGQESPMEPRDEEMDGAQNRARQQQPSTSYAKSEQAECSKTSQEHETPYSLLHSNRPRVLLCREGIPDVLKALYAAAEVSTMHEALCIVIHQLMMEAGFCVSPGGKNKMKQKDSEEGSCSESSQDRYGILPDNWKSAGLIRFRYEHPSCQGISCLITCTPLGPYTLAHGMVESDTDLDIYQCKITATDFVRVNVPLSATPSSVYFNLHRLSRIIKDHIALPLLSVMRTELGLPELVGFMSLPAEVKLVVLCNLDVKSILSLSCSCKELRIITADSSLWQHLCFRDFSLTTKESTSWKVEYIRNYKMMKEKENFRYIAPEQPYLPPYFGAGAMPDPMYPPGIIGGNSDLYPNIPFMPGGFHPPFGPGGGPGRVPRPRFDPFGPSPDQDPYRGRGRGRGDPSFGGRFGPRFL